MTKPVPRGGRHVQGHGDLVQARPVLISAPHLQTHHPQPQRERKSGCKPTSVFLKTSPAPRHWIWSISVAVCPSP